MPSYPHSCSYFVHQTPNPGHTLNAIAPISAPDRQARRERQLQRCDRLAELGMDLVECAHREALKETQPVQRPPLRIPGYPEYIPPPSSADYRSTTFSHLFQDFSRCVRQAILLQARLDSGAYDQARPATPHTQRAATQAPPAEPRAANDTTGLEYERLEDDLAAEASRDPEDILAGIETTLDAGKNLLAPVTLPRPASAIARAKAPPAPAPQKPAPATRPRPTPD